MQGTFMLGWLLVEQGQWDQGVEQMRQVAARLGREQTYNYALLAKAYLKAGQMERGLNAMAETLARVHKTGISYYEPELHRIKGELLLRQSVATGEDPEACFKQAIEISRRQSEKSLELRAVMSLSRLLQQQGKKEEARQLLSEIYGWFTEGFDTADLKEAKVLLEDLS
jgi:predicted ATPase